VNKTKIGDKILLVAPSGRTREVVVSDVIRDWDGNPIAIEIEGFDGPVSLPLKFFRRM